MLSRLIFITGATGFIGSKVLDVTLKAGYNVRLSIRKESQAQDLKILFPNHADQMSFVVVPDISTPNGFDGALQGVDYIFHIASPMPGTGNDFKTDYVDPAVMGTESILIAAKGSPNVKRVIIISSVLALMPLGGLKDPNFVVKENSEAQWPVDLNMKFAEGFEGHGVKYQASKILAHQATRRFVEERNARFSVVTLHPTFVIGHNIVQKSAQGLNGVNGLFVMSLGSEKPLFPPYMVHVDDVAEATLAASNANIDGNLSEFVLSGEKFGWDDVAKFVGEKYPAWPLELRGPFEDYVGVDTSRAANTLGASWRGMGEIISGVLDQQLKLRGTL